MIIDLLNYLKRLQRHITVNWEVHSKLLIPEVTWVYIYAADRITIYIVKLETMHI